MELLFEPLLQKIKLGSSEKSRITFQFFLISKTYYLYFEREISDFQQKFSLGL